MSREEEEEQESEYREQVSRLRAELDQSSATLDELNNGITELNGRLREIQALNSQRQSDDSAIKAAVFEIEQEYVSEMSSVQLQLAQLRVEQDRANARHEAAVAARHEVDQLSIEQLRGKINGLNEALMHTRQHLTILTKEAPKQTTGLESLTMENEALLQRVLKTQRVVSAQENQARALEAQVEERRQAAATAERGAQALEAEVDELMTQLSAQARQRSDKEEELAKIQEMVAQARKEAEAKEKELDSAQKDLVDAQRRTERLQRMVDERLLERQAEVTDDKFSEIRQPIALSTKAGGNSARS